MKFQALIHRFYPALLDQTYNMMSYIMDKRPHIIDFGSIGNAQLGYISVGQEFDKIPFTIKRTYWTYYTPQNVIRGGHANIDKELVIVAVCGSIMIKAELINDEKFEFILDSPHKGLYLPKLTWHTMKYTHNAVQLVMASNYYSEEDYIRDYKKFLDYRNGTL